MLAFASRIYKELGYDKNDDYPHLANILTVFGVNIGGAMTPISHSLAILGIGIYEGATGKTMSLFTYLAFGVPTGLILFVLMCIIARIVARPDMSRFKDFKIENVLKKQGPMTLREGTTALIFFATVAMWILPGILKMVSTAAWVNPHNGFGITSWAILSVVVMAVISIDGKPLLDAKTVVNKHINWGILLFISIGVYLGSAMSAESTGIVAAIQQNVVPLTQNVSAAVVVFLVAAVAILMTNFASNVSTITVMTGVGVALALSSAGAINPVGIALVTTMSGSCAYLLPSSFATIAMLHGDSFSSRNQIYLYGIIMIIVTSLVIGFIGYPIGCALTGG
jgi:di/tricarboxylate transporter